MNFEQFKELIIDSTDTAQIYDGGKSLAEKLNCPMDNLGSNLEFSLYCNDPFLCQSLGLYNQDKFNSDVREICEKISVEYHEHSFGTRFFDCLYSTDSIMMCDESELEKEFMDKADIAREIFSKEFYYLWKENDFGETDECTPAPYGAPWDWNDTFRLNILFPEKQAVQFFAEYKEEIAELIKEHQEYEE